MLRRIKSSIPFIILMLLLSACNIPFAAPPDVGVPGAALTSAAQTVQAQLQITITPTNTTLPPLPNVPINTVAPPASPIPPPTSICNASQFVTDVTVPDGEIMTPGENFTKTWRLKNVGTCSWTPAYAVVFSSGSTMSGPATQALAGNVNPGQTVDISVNLTAPGSNGDYTGYYKLRDGAGVLFAQFYVQIKVQGGGGGDPFAVTSVTYDLTTWDGPHQNCPRIVAHVTTNGAGTITYHWKRADSEQNTTFDLTYNSAGTKNINYDWNRGNALEGVDTWVAIIIDEPNHQEFGHFSLNEACDP